MENKQAKPNKKTRHMASAHTTNMPWRNLQKHVNEW